jgi:hypothetical protein
MSDQMRYGGRLLAPVSGCTLLTIPRSENFVLTPSVPVQLGREMTETLLRGVLDESK